MSQRASHFDHLHNIYLKHQRRKLRKQQAASREARRSRTAIATMVESLENRVMLAADVTITVEDVATIHDETIGQQNTPAVLDATVDENGNDIDASQLPTEFSNRLTALGADPSVAIGAALSGYDGANAGQNVVTIDPAGSTIENLALTDVGGDPLNGADSGLDTVSGTNILLFTDSENDNIVLGREEGSGDVVLAIYLDQNTDLTAGKFWSIQYDAIAHPDAGDGSGGTHDEPLALTNTLFVTASRDLEFDLTNAPSGQNLFIMFGDGSISNDPSEVGIVTTGQFPANESAGESINNGDTVNTSQGGIGPATFGVSNQMIDEGEGIYFTFVTGPEPDYTVPNLDQNEADVEANIQFDDVLDAKGAEFQVVQLQGGKTAELKVTAYVVDPVAAGAGFIDDDGLTGNTAIDITGFELIDFDNDGNLTAEIIDGELFVSNVEAGDLIRYFTSDNGDADHNRVLIENVGDGKGQDSADFDIGGFKLIQADLTTAQVGSTVYWEDDGPQIDLELAAGAVLRTDDGALTGGNAGGTTTDSAGLGELFTLTESPGADGDAGTVYELALGTNTTTSLVDVGTGETITLNLRSGSVEGRTSISGTLVFTLQVNSQTGAVTQTQLRAIAHTVQETESPYNDDTTGLGVSDAVFLSATLTDGDGDTANDLLDISNTIQFTDDGPELDLELAAGALLQTDDGALAGGNAGGSATDSAGAGDLFNIVSQSPGADGDAGTSFALALGANTTTGLLDSETNETVVLSLNGGVVEGRTESSGDLVFTVAIDSNTGEVTLSQLRAVEHATIDSVAPYNDDTTGLGVVDAILVSAILTDGDGDTAADNVDVSSTLAFTDDGPEVDFSNLVGAVTTDPQIGIWSESAGGDQPGTLTISANNTFEMVDPDGVSSTGTVTFDPTTGTGSLTADFDNDADNGDETIGFSLTVNSDGTYVFQLDEVIVPVVVLSTDEGQLPAGGPDPVQTLSFVDTSIVFFAVDAATATDVNDPIVPAIELGEPDLTEAELEAGAAPPIGDDTFSFIREEILMNVSTSGIGVNNNVLQGEDLAGDAAGTINSFDSGAFDESFVINPEPLASEIKVFISKTAGGFAPPGAGATAAKTDYLYYNVYDEFGNTTGPNLVEFADVTDEGDLWSFIVDADSIPGDSIDAVQFTMGFGNIKIPKIEIVVSGDAPPNDLFLDFAGTLTDADGDTSSTDFAIDLLSEEVEQAFDYVLVDAGAGPDAFNANEATEGSQYLVQGFDSGEDQLVLLNLADGFMLETGIDGDGDGVADDSRISSDAGPLEVVVQDATLSLADISEADGSGLNFLEQESAPEDDGLVMLLV